MKLSNIFLSFGAAAILFSCHKHEVVPAPTPKVDLYCHFIGKINNSEVEITQHVDDYNCESSKLKTILPFGGQSYAIYYSTIRSEQLTPYIKLGLGNLYYDASGSGEPPLTQFNSFFTSNTEPIYTMEAIDGFAVEYRDAQGRIWNSVDTMFAPQDVIFTNVVQESDASGDYSKFVCTFNCTVYHRYDSVTVDALEFEDAVFTGWYRR